RPTDDTKRRAPRIKAPAEFKVAVALETARVYALNAERDKITVLIGAGGGAGPGGMPPGGLAGLRGNFQRGKQSGLGGSSSGPPPGLMPPGQGMPGTPPGGGVNYPRMPGSSMSGAPGMMPPGMEGPGGASANTVKTKIVKVDELDGEKNARPGED